MRRSAGQPRSATWCPPIRWAGVPFLLLAAVALYGCARESTPLGFGALIGRVVDRATGQPVAGASVRPEGMRLAAGAGVSTDPEGRFRLEGLPSGRARLRVVAEGYEERLVADAEVPNEAAAEIEIEVSASGPPRAWVDGVVTDTAGRPLSDVAVSAGGQRVRTGTNGRYRVLVTTPERATLTFGLAGYATVEREVAVPGESARCDVTLEPARGGRIVGHVLDAHDGSPIAGAHVAAAGGSAHAVTGRDGGYALEAIASGPCTVTVTAGGFRAESRTVDVADGAGEPVCLDIPLVAPRTGAVRVRVTDPRDGSPLARVTVTAAPLGRSATSDTAGIAYLDHLPVGAYRLSLAREDFGRAGIESVSVEELTPTEVETSLRPTLAGLVGSLQSPSGAALADREILVTGLPRGTLALRTDRAGRFEAHGLFVGASRPTLRLKPVGGTAVANVTLAAGAVTDAGPLTLIPAGPG